MDAKLAVWAKPFANFQDQIALWEPRMVRVASDLVKKWGKRGSLGEGL